jgi:hypothetical protein
MALATAIDSIELTDQGQVIANLSVTVADGVKYIEALAGIGHFIATATDGAEFTDSTIEVTQLAAGITKISFTLKRPAIGAGIKAPGVDGEIKQAVINFTLKNTQGN